MADNKEIKISANVDVKVDAANAAMKKITDQFKGLERSSFQKMNQDFAKLSGVIKSLDKDLYKMMNTMSKKDASDQLKKMNDALLTQSKMLRDNTNEYKKLTDEIAKAANESERLQLEQKRGALVENNRAIMTSMEGHADRRDEARKTLGQGGVTFGGGLAIAGIAQVAKSLANATTEYMGSMEQRRVNYTGQAESSKQNMMRSILGGSLEEGLFAANGGHQKAMDIAKEQYESKHGQIATSMAADFLSGGLAAFGATGNPLAGIAGAAVGAGKNVTTRLVDQQTDTLGDIATKAEMAEYYNTASKGIKETTAPVTEIIDERIARSRGRLNSLQAAGGTEAQLFKNISRGTGAGYLESESLGMATMQGRSGLIGNERQNISGLIQAERSQIMSAGEFAGLEKRGAGVSAQSKQTAKMIHDAVFEGTRTGIDKSMIKDFTESALSLVEAGTTRADNLIPTMELIEKALSGKAPGSIGGAEIRAAASAVGAQQNLERGAGSAQLTGIQIGEVNKSLNKYGGEKVSTTARMRMATMTADEIGNSDNLRAQLQDAGVDVDAFLKDLKEGKATASLAPMITKNSALQPLLSASKREEFKKLTAAGKSTPEMEAIKNEFINTKALGGDGAIPEGVKPEDFGRQSWDLLTGTVKKGAGGMQNSVQGSALQGASLEAYAEGKKREASFAKDQNEAIKAAITQVHAIAEEMIKPGKALMGFENGIGTLNVSMKELTTAIYENTIAHGGKVHKPYEDEKPPKKTENTEHFKQMLRRG